MILQLFVYPPQIFVILLNKIEFSPGFSLSGENDKKKLVPI